MVTKKDSRVVFGLSELADTFKLEINLKGECTTLEKWLNTTSTFTDAETQFLEELYLDVQTDGNYWNEEELKIEMIGLMFRIAKVKVPNKIKVFYERDIAAIVEGYNLAVKADCLVAMPLPYNTPKTPYFFLQEYKKGRGEAKDPEAQMLTAMLIAQERNQDNKPIYGSYLFGSRWRFTTLIGKTYCTSREFNAEEKVDFLQIIFILRNLKQVILNR
jgi:hypothetical protein